MNKIYYILKLYFFVLPQLLFAQQNTISPYSYLGLGKFQDTEFAINSSSGGVGVALRSENYLNPRNPASLTSLTKTAYEFSLIGDFVKISDNESSVKYFNSTLSHLGIGFPISDKVAIMAGSSPYTFYGYDITNNNEVDLDGVNVPYQINHYGTGGLSRAFGSIGIELFEGFSIGTSGNMIFGTLSQNSDLIFNDLDENLFSSRDRVLRRIINFNFDLGLQLYKNLYDKLFTVGAFYHNSALSSNSYTTNEKLTYSYEIINNLEFVRDTFDLVQTNNSSFNLPNSLNLGISVLDYNNWSISLDYDYAMWSQLELFDFSNNFSDAYTIKFGGWYIPDIEDIHKYWKIIEYRFGFSYNSGYFGNNTQGNINLADLFEYTYTLGFGFPIRKSKSVINTGFQFGKLGNSDIELPKEKYLRINLSYTFNDKWFKKRKID